MPTALGELLAALRVEAAELTRAKDKLEARTTQLREQRRRCSIPNPYPYLLPLPLPHPYPYPLPYP